MNRPLNIQGMLLEEETWAIIRPKVLTNTLNLLPQILRVINTRIPIKMVTIITKNIMMEMLIASSQLSNTSRRSISNLTTTSNTMRVVGN